jgi:hypothetical protein
MRTMNKIDEAETLNLEKRAQELADEAELLRKESAVPAEKAKRDEQANRELDEALSPSLTRLRKIARE